MIINNDIHYSYNDITIVPEPISHINSRKECSPWCDHFQGERNFLPIFTAPMSSVINESNFQTFFDNGIIPILPRSEKLETRLDFAITGRWAAFSLEEFRTYFACSNNIQHPPIPNRPMRVLIDVANGHMSSIFELVKISKNIYEQNILIMVGNIANPSTYLEYAKVGVDYIRCGIGSGSGCITSSNVGVHYPMASLINNIKRYQFQVLEDLKYRINFRSCPKIVADGGIRNYNDVTKALALGADYVMIGGLFAECWESCGDKFILNEDGITKTYLNSLSDKEKINLEEQEIYTEFYGMASAKGQEAINGVKTKTSEGISKNKKVKFTLKQWTENMADYLRSAMSYTDCRTLSDFQSGSVDTIVISNNTYNSVNK